MSKNLIIVVVIAAVAAIWYFFFNGNSAAAVTAAAEAADKARLMGSPPYKPGNVAATVSQNWIEAKGWQYPDGSGAWCMIDALYPGGHPDRNANASNIQKQAANTWYQNNERKVYGFFKGFDLNPQKFDCGGWNFIKSELAAYLDSSSATDFNNIQVGQFKSLA